MPIAVRAGCAHSDSHPPPPAVRVRVRVRRRRADTVRRVLRALFVNLAAAADSTGGAPDRAEGGGVVLRKKRALRSCCVLPAGCLCRLRAWP